MSSLETTTTNILHLRPYEAYHSPEVQNSQKVPWDKDSSSFELTSSRICSTGLGNVFNRDDTSTGEARIRHNNQTDLRPSTSDNESMDSDNELVDKEEVIADADRPCRINQGLNVQQTHVHQDRPPSPAESNASPNDHFSGCQSRRPSGSINPQDIPAVPSSSRGNADIVEEIASKYEGGLIVLLPTSIQWSRFSTLVEFARSLGASKTGAFKLVVPEGVPGNFLPRSALQSTEYGRSRSFI